MDQECQDFVDMYSKEMKLFSKEDLEMGVQSSPFIATNAQKALSKF